jgi:hypothetical protein
VGDALGQAAVEPAVHDHRVDAHAAVVHGVQAALHAATAMTTTPSTMPVSHRPDSDRSITVRLPPLVELATATSSPGS